MLLSLPSEQFYMLVGKSIVYMYYTRSACMHEPYGLSYKKYISVVQIDILVPCGNIHTESPSVDKMAKNKSKHKYHMWEKIVYVVVGCMLMP